MSTLPISIDYTDKDFDALRARLIALLQSVFPEWSDFDIANFGNLLMEMFCFVGDVLTHYQDGQARESRIVTAMQRRNVIALARGLGYTLHSAVAATADVELTLGEVPDADVTFALGTVVRTKSVVSPVRFQILAPTTIPAGTDPPAVTASFEHSETHTQLVPASGKANQDVLLDRTPYLDGSAEVAASNGAYTQVTSLLNSGPNDRHYLVLVDQNDRATLRLGNGVNGALPTGTIAIEYKTGGGLDGNVEAGALEVLDTEVYDDAGQRVDVDVTNPDAASGGLPRQTIASAKAEAPESLRVLTRTVAREDFEINARRVPSVARALMLTSDEDTGIAENTGILFVVPEGGGTPSGALLTAVTTMITETYPHTLTFRPFVQAPAYRTIDVMARIHVAAGQAPATVAARVRAALAAHFQITLDDGTANPTVDFGYNQKDADGNADGRVSWSDILNVVRDTTGVRRLPAGDEGLTLNDAAEDVELAIRDFPVMGDVTIYNAATGELL